MPSAIATASLGDAQLSIATAAVGICIAKTTLLVQVVLHLRCGWRFVPLINWDFSPQGHAGERVGL